ncbi:MAG: hypothetical protein ABI284_01645 [Nitrosospira sp.]
MSVLHRLFPGCFLLLVSFFMTSLEAGQEDLKHNSLPSTYRFDEISIRITRQLGSPAFSIREIRLSAEGGAILGRGGGTVRFSFTKQDLLNLVNELYQLRFFELPSDYTAEYSIVQNEDGILSTMISSMEDEPSTSVCIFIKEYKKCVTYSRKGPFELENLVQRVFTKADEWAGRK